MNHRDAGGEFLTYLAVPKAHLQKEKWRSTALAAMLILTFIGLTVIPPVPAEADDQVSGADSTENTGIQVGSWLLTVPYCAGKSAFAVAGAIVGGLGYVFSGGNEQTAQSVWTTSVYGTYIIRPVHLRGEEPIQFLGKSDADDGGTRPVASPDKRVSAASGPLTE